MNRDSPGRPNISRIALGDLTNQLGKRGFSLISRSPASKSAVGTAKTVIKENNPQLAKRISLVDKNLKVEISGAKCPKSANAEKSLPLLKGGKTYRLLSRGNADSGIDSNPETGNQLSSAEESLGLFGSVNGFLNVVERGSVYSLSVSKYDLEIGGMSQDPEHKDESQTVQAEPLLETLVSQTASTDGMDSGFSSMPSNECPQFMGSRLTKLQSTKPFELEKCMLLKGDAMATSVAGADSLKSCSCSFCIQAAHIWLELHYMDAKGRISALVKSKKEAGNLVRLYSLDNGIGIGRGRGSSSHSPSELEFDLMNLSKSLFVSMEETFGMESSQLENEFSSLKDIRESFKMNLISQIPPPYLQHCAPDASPCKKIIYPR